MTVTVEFAPEVQAAFAEVNAKLDAISEKLDKLTTPAQTSLAVGDLKAAFRAQDYKAFRTN